MNCPTSPTLVITQPSPFASPRTTPRVSPRNSPWNSPKSSPHASPNVSPHASPSTSPQTSPTASPSVFRKPPPPVPPSDSDSDLSPPAIPERRYKVKERKSKAHKKGISYSDLASGKAPLKSNFNHNSTKLNYAELSHPAPEEPKLPKRKPEATVTPITQQNKNTTAPVLQDLDDDFDELFESSYDVPLPVMQPKHGQKQNNEQTEQNGFKNIFTQDDFDPFADDPFRGTDWPPSKDDECPDVAVHNNVLYNSKLPDSNAQKTRGAFSKAHSAEDVLDAPYRDSRNNKISLTASEIVNKRHEQFPDSKSVHQNLEVRKSWPAHWYSNPAYMGTFDPKQLEGTDNEQRDELLPGHTDNDDDMQFYEEDFQILEAQGYTRDEIKRALIVAENNFAMARKILKEFAQSNPNN